PCGLRPQQRHAPAARGRVTERHRLPCGQAFARLRRAVLALRCAPREGRARAAPGSPLRGQGRTAARHRPG
ncbi:hypothetical protein, partial [Streptomyces sp. AC550_RSS872]|uniref:hypothetical protein n=1 Tax=Streptomyces sp. AC550_RSS872 TaxID=2823689 RepID=UPI001C27001E